jgi:signal transduction histidine kinase
VSNIPVIYIGETSSPWLQRLRSIADGSNCLEVFEAREWFAFKESQEVFRQEVVPIFAVDVNSVRLPSAGNGFEESPHVFLRHPDNGHPQVRERGEFMALDFLKDDNSIQVTLLENWIKNRKEKQLTEARHLIASTIHDLRTPLSTIMGYCGWAHDIIADDQTSLKEIVDKISHNAMTMSEMINRNLVAFELDRGQLKVKPTAIVFEDMLVGDLQMYEILARNKNLNFYTEQHSSVPRCLCLDRFLVIQMLGNVIDNAVKFTDSGFVRVSASYDLSQEMLYFDIEDTGKGIHPENQEAIFSLFTQESDHVHSDGSNRGIGMGLDNARRIANAMEGDVILKQSRLYEGTTFSVFIKAPVAEVVEKS